MTLIAQDAAPVFDIPGATFTAYAAPSRGASQVSLWSVVDGVERPIGPGDCLILEPGATFSFRVGADEAFRAVACMRAGGRATLDGETFAPPWTV